MNATHWREKIQERLAAGGAIATEGPPPEPPTNAVIYNQTVLTQRVLKAVVLAIADGSIVAGGNQTPPQLKAAVVAKM